MATEISFKDVCRFIKEDSPEYIEVVDSVLGLLLIIAPVAIGGPAATLGPALGLLGVKNELTKIGRSLFDRLTRKKDEDNLAKHRRMQTAYGLLCFTAFLEALDGMLPTIRKASQLGPNEVFKLSDSSSLNGPLNPVGVSPVPNRGMLTDYRVLFPHPAESFEVQHQMLEDLYTGLSNDFQRFIENTKSWSLIKDTDRATLENTIRQLPKLSLKYFDAQYFVLATIYDDFFIWSNLHEQREIRKQITRLSGYVQDYIKLADAELKAPDIGLTNMREVLNRIPETVEARLDVKIVSELDKFYSTQIQRPIIRDSSESSDEVNLTYPTKAEIFVPQAFRLLKHSGHQQLGDEQSWRDEPVRDDLGAFLLSYLSSPYSTETALIILGHPGSGKSLLTEVLAANLISTSYTCIRVVLRDVFADCDVTSQIEQQLRKDLGRSLSWVNLADQVGGRPLLIIFDGYDELLQTSGQVVTTFISQLQQFQEREATIRQPVRVVVTSRITLIDRAEIPRQSTVIRLEDFDLKKQAEWIAIWNRVNASFFAQTNLRPFVLPTSNPRLLELSRHPLLLLMLAIFDSDENSLEQSKNLDRTELYYKLIFRFVERERYKDPAFRLMDPEKRVEELEVDIERLGLVAMGMFNRKRLHIHKQELEQDLDLYKLNRYAKALEVRGLSRAEELAGSFFFIFESRTLRGYQSEKPIITSAIEFLHNTFGEFLTADFILRQLLIVTKSRDILRGKDGTNQFKWFTSLMYTSLHTRPVILEMIGEWFKHRVETVNASEEGVKKSLHAIVAEQTERLVLSDDLTTMIMSHNLVHKGSSAVGLLATYSLNLILLELALSQGGFNFLESKFDAEKNSVWDVITNLWRAWFSESSLFELSTLMEAYRDAMIIRIQPRKSKHQYNDAWFERFQRLSSTLADDGLEQAVRALVKSGHYSWR